MYGIDFFMRFMAKNSRQKVPKSSESFSIFSLHNYQFRSTYFLFLPIFCNFKIERLLVLKFLKKLAFFDSYFWPFNKSHEKNQCRFYYQVNHGFNLKYLYQIPLTWWAKIKCMAHFACCFVQMANKPVQTSLNQFSKVKNRH